MEIIRVLVQNIIVIVILAVFMDMFLPAGDMKRYVKLVMGLLVIIAVLGALGNLIRRDWVAELPDPAVNGGPAGSNSLSEIMSGAKKIKEGQKEMALEEYRRSLARQAGALAGLSAGEASVSAQVDIYDKEGDPKYGQVKEIRLTINSNPVSAGEKNVVQPVSVRVGEKHDGRGGQNGQDRAGFLTEEVRGKIKTTIANFYNLSPSQVKVNEDE